MTRLGSLYYLPSTWGEFCGLDRQISHFKNLIRLIRVERKLDDLSTILKGPPGTGKSALVRKFGQSILCENLNLETLECCHRCRSCEDLTYLEGNDDIMSRFEERDFIFSSIDCTKIVGRDLEERLGELKSAPSIVRIAHLEEVATLGQREQDKSLLIPMDDRGFLWVGTGMTTTGLQEAFLRRFPVKLSMHLPDPVSLALWLAKRCKERGIDCEKLDILQMLAERANCRVGIALNLLKFAGSLPIPKITKDLVEDFVFEFDD